MTHQDGKILYEMLTTRGVTQIPFPPPEWDKMTWEHQNYWNELAKDYLANIGFTEEIREMIEREDPFS